MRGAINKEERFMKKLLKSVAALSLSAMMLLSPGVLAEEDEEESNVVELTTVVQEYEGKQIVLKLPDWRFWSRTDTSSRT